MTVHGDDCKNACAKCRAKDLQSKGRAAALAERLRIVAAIRARAALAAHRPHIRAALWELANDLLDLKAGEILEQREGQAH